jgi:hypothetical protein
MYRHVSAIEIYGPEGGPQRFDLKQASPSGWAANWRVEFYTFRFNGEGIRGFSLMFRARRENNRDGYASSPGAQLLRN